MKRTCLFLIVSCFTALHLPAQSNQIKDNLKKGEYQMVVTESLYQIAQNPTLEMPHHYYAVSSFYLGHYQNSISGFSRLLALDPTSAVTYANRGGAYASIGCDSLAILDLEKSFDLELQDNNIALNNRAVVLIHNGKLKEALNDLDEVIRLEAGDESVYNNMSELYMYQSDSVKALDYIQMTISRDPENQDAFNKTLLLLRNKMDSETLNRLCEHIVSITTKNIERYPEVYDNYYYRAQAYDALNRKYDAENDYWMLLKILSEQIIIFPKSYIFLCTRGEVYEKLGEMSLAINDFDAVKAINEEYYNLKNLGNRPYLPVY